MERVVRVAVRHSIGQPRSSISTKLQPPILPLDFVPRSRLSSLLRAGIGRKLTLVRAPAGFGKTTLVAGWLLSEQRPAAWLSLDEHDSDTRRFLAALVGAIQTIQPEAGRRVLALLTQLDEVSPTYLGTVVADDLARLGDNIVMVLDDYHVIQQQALHQILSTIVRRLPPNVQLVITSRAALPISLAALRAQHEVVEVQADDLRFNPDEVQALLSHGIEGPTDRASVSDFVKQSEGWAVGLRLMMLDGPPDMRLRAHRSVVSPTGPSAIGEYLSEEVFERQSHTIRRFLLQTSLVDRLCASLGDQLVDGLNPGDSRRLLDQIEQDGLFLTQLDREQEWYRYHDLFRDTARRRLRLETEPGDILALHHRASSWFADVGLIDEAIQHALLADDIGRAADLIELALPGWMEREQWAPLDTWLHRLPQQLIEERPLLALGRCRLLIISGQFNDLGAQLRRLDTLLTNDPPPVQEPILSTARGQVNAQLSYEMALRGGQDQRAYERADLALRQLPVHQVDMRATASLMFGITSQMLGHADAALAWLRDQLDHASESQPAYTGRLLLSQGYVELACGRFTRLMHTGRELLALATSHGLMTDMAWARYLLGRVAYEWNDLEAARTHFEAGLAVRDRANHLCVWNTVLGLALALLAGGEGGAARQLVLNELELAEQTHRSIVVESLRSFEARLALAAGEIRAAAEWMDAVPPTPRAPHAFDIENPLVTRARILLAQDTPSTLRQSLAVLDEALALAEGRSTVPQIVEVRGIQACVHQALNQTDAAADALTHALDLAEPGRLTRVFVDLGPQLTSALTELTKRGTVAARRVLAACRSEVGPTHPALPSRVTASLTDVDALTWRELEILQLLDARYSNKEIARTLCISSETVKKHAAHIYGKLQVTGRREAVVRARELGLLRLDDTVRLPAPGQ